ncbi:protein of unknown function [Magnetospirillum gryphiswaldense MSR-1 v2]|jgi:hypothetical protein|uniref:Transposase n=1 Tax=Magnetospirillum gryphiswaldense (strain DSM 6361 / JCM 21280 / NBRC 15271 / MSR-1) TaxID=431944 RepID=V6F5K2_MAGGM|nr:protein of unknown function [Magnetospirillum gryphiswaldense MSR-1 v2]
MSGVRLILKDHQWDRMAPHLPGKRSDPGRTSADNAHTKLGAPLYWGRSTCVHAPTPTGQGGRLTGRRQDGWIWHKGATADVPDKWRLPGG